MRRLSKLAAAIATVFAVGGANASVILIDDFNGPDQIVFDSTTGGAAVSQVAAGPNSSGLIRTVTHEYLANPPTVPAGTNDNGTGSQSSVLISSSVIPTGTLNIQNTSFRDSQVTVAWTLPAGFIPLSAIGPAAAAFSLTFSDISANAELKFNGVSFGNYALPSFGGPGAVPFGINLTAAQQNAINLGGTLEIVLNGDAAWDLTVDSFGFVIPEPTSLALVGLGLLGAGLASRRRRA